MKLSAKTDKGLVRETNEDNVSFGLMTSYDCAWGVVCDGMGGANAGEVASKMACDSISRELSENYSDSMSDEDSITLLADAMENANYSIYRRALKEPEKRGMGTTAVSALIKPERIYIASAGDSRAYIYKNGRIKQITKDHSYVQELVDKNLITQEEAQVHPNKNFITKALGTQRRLGCSTYTLDFEQGELLLICSDGLTNYVPEPVIADIIAITPFNRICDALIQRACTGGGGDNVTVFIAGHND